MCTVYFMTAITNVLSILFFKNRLSQRHHLHCVGEKTPPGRLTGPCGSCYSIQKWILSCFWTVPSLQISLRMLPLKAIEFKVYKSLCVHCSPASQNFDLWLWCPQNYRHNILASLDLSLLTLSLVLQAPASLDFSLLTVSYCVSLHLWTLSLWIVSCCKPCSTSEHRRLPLILKASIPVFLSCVFSLPPSFFPPTPFLSFGLYNVSKQTRNTQTLRCLKPNRFYLGAL